MATTNRKHRRKRRRRLSYIREFGFEIIVVLLLLVGGFLLVEKTDVSAIVTNWLKAGFKFVGKNIQVHMHTNNVNPQEAIGLLEMAKDQILSNLRKGRQEIFSSFKKPDEEVNK